MLEIDVFLGLNTAKITGLPSRKVEPDIAASHSGDDIFWHFHALDPKIKFVEIEFDEKSDEFFDARGGGHTNRRYARLETYGAKGGHGHILGTTPALGEGGGTKASKYTVRAYTGDPDKAGKVIRKYTLDPIVVTCDP